MVEVILLERPWAFCVNDVHGTVGPHRDTGRVGVPTARDHDSLRFEGNATVPRACDADVGGRILAHCPR